jgi:hypothetical protein
MKKLFQLVTIATLFLASSTLAFAQKSATEQIRSQIDNAVGLKVGSATGSDIKLGTILSALLPYLYVAGGFILFIMMIWGGFEMLTGATEQKSQEAGKQRITTAVIGFILLFVSYWIASSPNYFGIRIL